MEILKFENSSRPVRKKSSSSKVMLGLAGIAAVALLGSTLAANISLNGGSGVEFGQGVALMRRRFWVRVPAQAFWMDENKKKFKFSPLSTSPQ